MEMSILVLLSRSIQQMQLGSDIREIVDFLGVAVKISKA